MKKILVIRFSSIGDIVLTTPVVRALKEQLNAEVHYLTKKNFVSFLEPNPNIDKIYSIEKEIDEVVADLKAQNYDFVIDLHNNLRTARLKKALKRPQQSFKKLNLEKWLLVNFKIDKMPDIHIVDRYIAAGKELGIKNDNKGLDYFILKKDEVVLNSLPTGFNKGYIGFVIGGQHATKMLPEEKIISIISKLDKKVVLLGGPEDAEKGSRIEKAIGDNVYNGTGKYKLNQSASLVKQADAIITHDTGLMHIAAAFKKKIISVWGNTVPELGMYPYLAGEGSQLMEVKDLNCRPCSKIGSKKCPKGHFKCMVNQDEEAIVSALR